MTEEELLAAISAAIFTNTGKSISGNTLRDLLLQMVGRLVIGSGNNVAEADSVVLGENNSVVGTRTTVVGNQNSISGISVTNDIVGFSNSLANSSICQINGYDNQINNCSQSAIRGNNTVLNNCLEVVAEISNFPLIESYEQTHIASNYTALRIAEYPNQAAAVLASLKAGQFYRIGTQVHVIVV